MKEILNHLYNNNNLTKSEAKSVLKKITKGTYNNSQIASFLTVFLMRPITVDELEGFRDAMLDLCIPVNLEDHNIVDLCGTGGDGKNTFNISTASSFVVAGTGQKVAKHGNNGVSSFCGSSNVLSYFGYEFTNDNDKLLQSLEESNICFLHAPLFHPALKPITPIRSELGVKTFFNMLGPMVNPSSPKNQLIGVFNLELARLYSYIYQKTNKNYVIVHGIDGYDEISLTNSFKLISNYSESIIHPKDIDMPLIKESSLFAGHSIKNSVEIFLDILSNKSDINKKNVVLCNAAYAICCAKNLPNIKEGLLLAKESLESGKALESFKKFIKNE